MHTHTHTHTHTHACAHTHTHTESYWNTADNLCFFIHPPPPTPHPLLSPLNAGGSLISFKCWWQSDVCLPTGAHKTQLAEAGTETCLTESLVTVYTSPSSWTSSSATHKPGRNTGAKQKHIQTRQKHAQTRNKCQTRQKHTNLIEANKPHTNQTWPK